MDAVCRHWAKQRRCHAPLTVAHASRYKGRHEVCVDLVYLHCMDAARASADAPRGADHCHNFHQAVLTKQPAIDLVACSPARLRASLLGGARCRPRGWRAARVALQWRGAAARPCRTRRRPRQRARRQRRARRRALGVALRGRRHPPRLSRPLRGCDGGGRVAAGSVARQRRRRRGGRIRRAGGGGAARGGAAARGGGARGDGLCRGRRRRRAEHSTERAAAGGDAGGDATSSGGGSSKWCGCGDDGSGGGAAGGARSARREHLEAVVPSFGSSAGVDAFEANVHAGLARAERTAAADDRARDAARVVVRDAGGGDAARGAAADGEDQLESTLHQLRRVSARCSRPTPTAARRARRTAQYASALYGQMPLPGGLGPETLGE